MSNVEKLKQIWRVSNFPNKLNLYKLQKEANLGFTQKQVGDWLEKQESHQTTTAPKKQKVFSSVIAPHVGSNLMLDLIVYDRYKSNGYQYILNGIDIKSRKAYGIPLKDRKEVTLIDAMKKMFKHYKHVFPELQMDNEGAFAGKKFQNEMDNLGVKTLWFSEAGDLRKQSVVERNNRTVAEMLQRWRQGTGRTDWENELDHVYNVYNSTEHSTIKAKPDDVWDGSDTNKQTVTVVEHDFKKGDKVRLKQHKQVFTKGDALKFSKELYTVMKKVGQKYVLHDEDDDELARRYSGDEMRKANEIDPPEIVKTRFKKKQREVHEKTQDERKVKTETNKLATKGHSKFLDDIKKGLGKRVRKPKQTE